MDIKPHFDESGEFPASGFISTGFRNKCFELDALPPIEVA
jgi:hypothetical protein